MRRVNLIVPPGVNSFYYSAKYTYSYIDPSRFDVNVSTNYKVGAINVLIWDLVDAVKVRKKAHIWWVDTPQYIDNNTVEYINKNVSEVWVTSPHLCKFKNCSVLGRLPHPSILSIQYVNRVRRDIDLLFIGEKNDRKNWKLFEWLCDKFNLKCVATYKYDKYNINELISLYLRSKVLFWVTYNEGFGLPLLEAQLLGVLPLCINAHASEYYCYINEKVRVSETKIIERGGKKFIYYMPNISDVAEILEKLLSASNIDRCEVAGIARDYVANTAAELNEKLYRAYTKYF